VRLNQKALVYPEVPIISLQSLGGFLSALGLIIKVTKNPERLDLIIRLYSLLYTKEYLSSLEQEMKTSGLKDAAALAACLEIPSDEILSRMPKGSLGFEFYHFKNQNHLNPADARMEIESEYSELFLAFSNTHDIWHVVTGFDLSQEDEVGLQAFYLSQHATPLAAVLISLALLRSLFFGLSSFVRVFDRACRGWQMGKDLRRKLITLNWSRRWHEPIDSLRSELNIVAA